MIIFRYLAKEVWWTLLSLTAILMLIFLSNQFILYLNRAAAGSIPMMIIMKLMIIELPTLLCLLLPLGFYVAMLLAYGRLYADSEMIVLQACGYGPKNLLKHSLIMAAVVSFVLFFLMFWLVPEMYKERAKLLRTTGIQTLMQTIIPGRFHSIEGGQKIFYVQAMSRNHKKAEQIFLARQLPKENQVRWDVLWAEKAFAKKDANTGEDYLILQQGREYQGVPGQANYQVTQFSEYQTRLPHPVVNQKEDFRAVSWSELWPSQGNLKKIAELQWRFSVPIMVFVLTLVAVPLSRVNPRSGKFARLLPAIVIYILYANLMFMGRNAIATGHLPPWLGLWSIHGLVALLGLFLIWRNQVKPA